MATWTSDLRRHALSPSFAAAIQAALEQPTDGFPVPLNVRPDPVDVRDYPYKPTLVEIPTFKLPPVFPGTSQSDILVVRNQREEGSCTGNALAAAIDIQNIRRRSQGADVPDRVSARMLYSAARAFDEFPDDDLPGSSIRGALKGFWNRGACSDSAMPYLAGWQNDALTVDISHDARRVSLGTYMRLRHVLNDYHCALSEADAIIVSAMVHDGWRHEKVKRADGKIIMRKLPLLEGAHAFAVVGYTPQGFLILNSWGGSWGHYNFKAELASEKKYGQDALSAELAAVYERSGRKSSSAPGVALWPYDDWQRHVLVAWVFRLAAPTKLPSGITGGYISSPRSEKNQDSGSKRNVREAEVLGHLVHMSGEALVQRGLFASPRKVLSETGRFLSSDPKALRKYRHVVLFAHDAFDTRDDVLARAGAMIPVFKRNGIYPFFLLWQSNFNEIVGDLLRSLMPKALEKAGTHYREVADNLLERMSAPVGTIMWENMKKDANSAFSEGTAVTEVAEMLVRASITPGAEQGRSLHIIAHGSGSFLAGELVHMLGKLNINADVRTVSLLAPACSIEFAQCFSVSKNTDVTVYALDESDEKRPDPRLGGYGKSKLWLISRAFEQMGTDIAGLVRSGDKFGASTALKIASRSSSFCRATNHDGFDNDPFTMNHILRRITGRNRLNDGNGGFRLAEIGERRAPDGPGNTQQ